MNVVRVLAETEDTVTLSRADFEALVRAREDAIDNAAFDAAEEREARLGKEAARADYLTLAEVRRLEAGEHPLRVWREHRGMSLRELAAAAGVAFNYISEIEGGRKPGSAEALRRLAVVLGVAMEDLMPVALNDDETPGSAASAED
jgi:ribosome-binding protein aMBF1 (putative translation factor)